MSSLFEFLSSRTSEISFTLIILVLVLASALGVLWMRFSQLRKRWHTLLQDSSSQNLELLLRDHLRERLVLQNRLEEVQKHVSVLQEKMETSKRHLGLVRYDAFDDVGGAQSFALAVYDDRGNGAIMNGIIGRSDSRVYCKPLMNGSSERNLSQEELRAIEEAKRGGPKSIIS